MAYLQEVENLTGHLQSLYDGPRGRELSPTFYEAAWNLCRRGVLRPGVARLGGQATPEGASGNGYSLTSLGRAWVEAGDSDALISESRLGELFGRLSERAGPGFLQRANEAVLCHEFGAYLACCAMCGAAAESILLSVGVAKSGDEIATLRTYRAANGRRNVTDGIVGNAPRAIAAPFRSATELLSYWRDDAAHGVKSTISEIEAHEALARLLRFAQFSVDNWDELTGSGGSR